MNMFYTYLRLYPGFADRIIAGIEAGNRIADEKNIIDNKQRNDIIEECILDRCDP